MLVSSRGHIKLTDFGLSKIELSRDLEMSDLINCSPSLNTRTPGQLLSLTCHLSFGSNEKKRLEANKDAKGADTSHNDALRMNESKISGVSPFFSAEDLNFSASTSNKLTKVMESSESSSSYNTADASSINSNIYLTSSANEIKLLIDPESDKENSMKNFSFSMMPNNNKTVAFKFQEDSGISSRKGDMSAISGNANNELSVGNYSNTTASDLSRSNISDKSKHELHSPIRPMGRGFKRPDFHRSMTRKRTLTNRADFSIDGEFNQHTGLTQEIEICMDIGSSTPKKHKTKDSSPGLMKIKSSPDDDTRLRANSNVIVSTPVSTQKINRGKKKNAMLRFAVPHSSLEQQKKLLQYVKMTEDPAMSPIQSIRSIDEITPKMAKTPFRTPKTVRRGIMGSDERILGTPDYLAPELLLM